MRDHLAAIAALIPAGIHVYMTEADRPDYDPADWSAEWTAEQREAWTLPDRYVILSAPTMPETSMTINGTRRHISSYVQVKAVGTSDRQSRWVHEQVRTALDPVGGARPVVEGYTTHLHLGPTGIHTVDRDVTPHRFWASDSYRYSANPL
ncbi:hypothetical protein [Demequina sp. SO4-18]|uniref:hypothetical protein n=1 Tax=Demequina sp. SO4-18 TaxID=3401026 RepID=UPI003B5C4274